MHCVAVNHRLRGKYPYNWSTHLGSESCAPATAPNSSSCSLTLSPVSQHPLLDEGGTARALIYKSQRCSQALFICVVNSKFQHHDFKTASIKTASCVKCISWLWDIWRVFLATGECLSWYVSYMHLFVWNNSHEPSLELFYVKLNKPQSSPVPQQSQLQMGLHWLWL